MRSRKKLSINVLRLLACLKVHFILNLKYLKAVINFGVNEEYNVKQACVLLFLCFY